ncbi:unnamed protein product [Parnassius mnemosyne]|uniref:Peptidoglycan recognition protein n=1 Tax=Parnassius mnemosyne TaxID=213953 RepID=A0AAV1L7E2_9NEOP
MFLIALVFSTIYGITIGVPAILPAENEVMTHNFPFVTRLEWGARTPIQKSSLPIPVPYVVIHHSYTPPACYESAQCENAMRCMQDLHMDCRGWWDIGYNFAVGSEGVAYEGRGWDIQGAHSLYFNSISIGICLIGDWTNSLPPTEQIKAAKSLIAQGVELGFIRPDYKLIGHRQIRKTECPGATLYQNLKTWDHYASFPASPKDLLHVEELPENVKSLLRKNTTLLEK